MQDKFHHMNVVVVFMECLHSYVIAVVSIGTNISSRDNYRTSNSDLKLLSKHE